MATGAAITPTASGVLSPTACMTARPRRFFGGGQPGARPRVPGAFQPDGCPGHYPYVSPAGTLARHAGVIVRTIHRHLEEAREIYRETCKEIHKEAS